MEARPLIAIFCNSFPPERGAAAQRMHHMALLLRNAGYRVEVVSSLPNYPTGRIFPGYRSRLQQHDCIDGIPVQRCWLYPSNSGSAFPRAVSLLSQLASFRLLAFRRIRNMQPALVIVSSPPLPMAAAAVQYFYRVGTPVLLNISDLWPLSARALGAASESWTYRFLQGREHRMYRQAAAICGQSRAILEHAAGHGAGEKPMLLLRNLPQPRAAGVTNHSQSHSGPFRIIYPGLLGHAQGLRALIAAVDWRGLNAELVIYGDGAERDLIDAWIREHSEQPVRLLPPVSQDALWAAFADFDAMLVPLVSEIPGAVPSKLFTAIHAGLPVLYSAGGEGADLVREYGLGIVSAPGDYTALAGAIRSMQELDAISRQQLQGAMQQAASSAFNRQVQDADFLRFIVGLLQARTSS